MGRFLNFIPLVSVGLEPYPRRIADLSPKKEEPVAQNEKDFAPKDEFISENAEDIVRDYRSLLKA